MLTQLFDGKVALVTGGASGIGAAFARTIVRDGGRIAIADLNEDMGQTLVAELGAGNASFTRTDVSQQDDVIAFVDGAAAHFGRIDILFNNAGIGGMGTTLDLDAATFRRVIEVDLYSVFYGCKAALPHMVRNGSGAIVNNASISGMLGDFGMTAYNTAKGGVVNYTRALAMDMAKSGIRVNAICPGCVDTPLFAGLKAAESVFDNFIRAVPMTRIGQPEEIAEVVAFLASDKASYMTGAIIPVDGGITATSGFPDLAPFMEILQRGFNA